MATCGTTLVAYQTSFDLSKYVKTKLENTPNYGQLRNGIDSGISYISQNDNKNEILVLV